MTRFRTYRVFTNGTRFNSTFLRQILEDLPLEGSVPAGLARQPFEGLEKRAASEPSRPEWRVA